MDSSTNFSFYKIILTQYFSYVKRFFEKNYNIFSILLIFIIFLLFCLNFCDIFHYIAHTVYNVFGTVGEKVYIFLLRNAAENEY